jgi:MFS transporter, FSR family, fosmidomycin resistance protein
MVRVNVSMKALAVAKPQRSHAAASTRLTAGRTDRPRLFAVLTCVEVIRSTISFGVNTFVSLYWIRHLGASSALGGLALTLGLGGGVLGTLAGGRIADRLGLVRTVQLGQDYLPSRPGTAAGVTLGLAVSAGGLFMPVLGLVAEHHGPRGVFVALAVMPVIAVAVSALLREPLSAARRGACDGTRPRTGRPG